VLQSFVDEKALRVPDSDIEKIFQRFYRMPPAAVIAVAGAWDLP